MATSSLLRCFVGSLVISVLVGSAGASVVSFATPAGASVAGGPIVASAVFTTGPGTVIVDLTNLTPDILGASQGLNGVVFTLNSGQTNGSLAFSSGIERTVNDNSSFADSSAPVPTGWAVFSTDTGLNLTGLGVKPAWPSHILIGPPDAGGQYSSANGSIAGNGSHNPFLAGTVHFVLSVPGVTADSQVTGTVFTFGTSAGQEAKGQVVSAPEPSALALLALGLLGLIKRRQGC